MNTFKVGCLFGVLLGMVCLVALIIVFKWLKKQSWFTIF